MCPRRPAATIPNVLRHCNLRNPRTWLAVLVAVIVASLAPVIVLTSAGPDSPGATAAAVALLVVQAGTLLWMPTHPERAMSVAIAAGVGLELLCPDIGHLGVATIPLSALSWLRPPRISLWALGAMVLLSPLELATGGGVTAMLVAIGSAAFAWTWGELWRTRRGRRADAARRAIADERARIARELHDVVAHNVSLIVVQAVAAEDVFDARPDVARDALHKIEASGRAALAELRRLLETVRPDSTDAGDEANEPQPGLDRLDALAASVQAAGLAVVVRREGPKVALPAGVDLSAYRIVQEALTNTLRHAGATRAEVTVRYGASEVGVEVVDDGGGAPAGAPEEGGGHGIVGMRERAALVGGTVEVGTAPGGGFRVRAELPLGAGA
jgi:signal transduction histidine kinase